MGAQVFGLRIKAETVGEQQVARLETALNRALSSTDKLSQRTKQGAKDAATAFDGIPGKIKAAFTDPMGAATEGVEGLFGKLGGVGAIVGGFATGVAAAGAATFALAKSTASLAEQQSNNALRLGVSIKQYGLMAQASEDAGLGTDALAGTMRGLSQSLKDGTAEGNRGAAALRKLGIEAKDAFGGVVPINDLLLTIADRLGAIQNPAERAEKAIAIFGRSGLEVLPLMTANLRAAVEENERLGAGFSETQAQVALRFDSVMDRLSARMAAFRKDQGVQWAEFWLQIFGTDSDRAAMSRERNQREAANLSFDIRLQRMLDAYVGGNRGGPIDPLGLTSGSLSRLGPRAPANWAMTQQSASARSGVNAILSQDPRYRLQQAQREFNEALESGNVAEMKSSQARVKSIEAEIKAITTAETATRRFTEARAKLNETVADFYRAELRGTRGRPADAATAGLLAGGDIEFALGQLSTYTGRYPTPSTGRGTSSIPGLLLSQQNTQADAQQRLRLDQQALEYQAKKLSLMAGPGGEVDAIERITSLRLNSIKEEKEAGGDLFDLEMRRRDALAGRELQLLEIRRRGVEEFKSSVMQGFDALIAGGGGISSFLRSQAVGVGRTAAGNLAEMIYKPGRLSLPGIGTASNPSFLGKLLKGTPLGADPAAGIQLSAAQMQLQAAQMQVGAAAGGGISGGIGGGMTGLGPLFSGSQGNMIFNQNGIPYVGSDSTGSWYGYGDFGGPVTPGKSGLSAGQKIGIAGAAAAGAYGIYSGVQTGGAKGVLTAGGSAAGAGSAILGIAGVTGPAAPILAGIGLGVGLITSLFPDPKKQRADELQAEAERRAYTEVPGVDYLSDMSGNSIDYDYRGGSRTYRVVQNVTINAMDAASFSDFSKKNSTEFASAVTHAVIGGQAEDLRGVLSQR